MLTVIVTVSDGAQTVARSRDVNTAAFTDPVRAYIALVGVGVDALNEAADVHAKYSGVELHPQGGEHRQEPDTRSEA
jgi:hypothetical protein